MSGYEDSDDDDSDCRDKKTSCGRYGFSLQFLIYFSTL